MDSSPKEAATRLDDTLVLVASNTVLFPGVVMSISAGHPASASALQEVARGGGHVAVVLQRDPSVEAPTLADLYPIGTEARLLRYVTARDGAHHAIHCPGRRQRQAHHARRRACLSGRHNRADR